MSRAKVRQVGTVHPAFVPSPAFVVWMDALVTSERGRRLVSQALREAATKRRSNPKPKGLPKRFAF